MKITYSDLEDACLFANVGGGYETIVYLCKQTGKFYYETDFSDLEELESIPDDITDENKYIALPDKYELDLGQNLTRDFISANMPNEMDKLREIFSKRGAYRRYKDWLINIGKIDDWYDYENKATEKALREWCKENGIQLAD